MDPMGRMKLKSGNKADTEPEVLEESVVEETAAVPEVAEVKPTEIEDPLIEDLDLTDFFFTGKIEYQFSINKLKFTLKLLSSEELSDTHKILWECFQAGASSDIVSVEHAIAVISRVLVKYGKVSLEDKALADKMAFVKSTIPGILLPKIMKKYSILEKSVEKLFADPSTAKN